MRREPSEAGELWRALREENRQRRSTRQAEDEVRIGELARRGRLHAATLAPGHWTLAHPARPESAIDYYSRTGTSVRGSERLGLRGLPAVLRHLDIDTEE